MREGRMVRVQDPACTTNVRPDSALVMNEKNLASHGPSNDRPRSAPVSWMAAITARVNALWDAFNHRPSIVAPAFEVRSKDVFQEAISATRTYSHKWAYSVYMKAAACMLVRQQLIDYNPLLKKWKD